MLYQKMRPQTFDAMVGQDVVVKNIRNQSKRNAWFQAYILEGQLGSGKTTIARIINLSSNCENKDNEGNPCLCCERCKANMSETMDFKEIDGASNTGVDNIRELKSWMDYRPLGNKKVGIIDEVHRLSPNAFDSLLKILEEPPSYAIFILCTTNIDSIPWTVRSRCAEYRFGQIPENLIADHVAYAAKENNINIEEEACVLIAKYSGGAMRNALKLLQQLSVSGELITNEICKEIIGVTDEESIFGALNAVLCQDVPKFLSITHKMVQIGKNLSVLADDLLSACTDLIVAASGCLDNVTGTTLYKASIKEMYKEYTLAQFCDLSEQIMQLRQAVRVDASKNWFIVSGIAMIQTLKANNAAIEHRVFQLQQEVSELRTLVNESARVKPLLELSSGPVELVEESNVLTATEETTVQVLEEGMSHVSEPEEAGEFETPYDFEEELFDDDLLVDFGSDSDDLYKLFENSVSESQNKKCNLTESNNASIVNAPSRVLSLSEVAEERLLSLCTDNPELKVHLTVGCKKEHTAQGLILITPEPSVCNALLLYIGKTGIENVTVRCGKG